MRTFAVESLPLLIEELRIAAQEGPVRLTLGGKVTGIFLSEDEFEEHERALNFILGQHAEAMVREAGQSLGPEESLRFIRDQLIEALPKSA